MTTVTNVAPPPPPPATTTITILDLPSGAKIGIPLANDQPTMVGSVTAIPPRKPAAVPTVKIIPSVSETRQKEITTELTATAKEMANLTDMLRNNRSGTNINLAKYDEQIKSKETELGMYAAGNVSLSEAKTQLANLKVALAEVKVRMNTTFADSELKEIQYFSKMTKDEFRVNLESNKIRLETYEKSIKILLDVVDNQTSEASFENRKVLGDKVLACSKELEIAKAKFGDATKMTKVEAKVYDVKDSAKFSFNTIKTETNKVINSFLNLFRK